MLQALSSLKEAMSLCSYSKAPSALPSHTSKHHIGISRGAYFQRQHGICRSYTKPTAQ